MAAAACRARSSASRCAVGRCPHLSQSVYTRAAHGCRRSVGGSPATRGGRRRRCLPAPRGGARCAQRHARRRWAQRDCGVAAGPQERARRATAGLAAGASAGARCAPRGGRLRPDARAAGARGGSPSSSAAACASWGSSRRANSSPASVPPICSSHRAAMSSAAWWSRVSASPCSRPHQPACLSSSATRAAARTRSSTTVLGCSCAPTTPPRSQPGSPISSSTRSVRAGWASADASGSRELELDTIECAAGGDAGRALGAVSAAGRSRNESSPHRINGATATAAAAAAGRPNSASADPGI